MVGRIKILIPEKGKLQGGVQGRGLELLKMDYSLKTFFLLFLVSLDIFIHSNTLFLYTIVSYLTNC